MISLLKAVIGYYKSLGKRGELRNDDILLAPKLSSSNRILKFLSSRVLPKMLSLNLSFGNLLSLYSGSSPRVTEEEEHSWMMGESLIMYCHCEENRKVRCGNLSKIKKISRDPHVGFSILLRMTIQKGIVTTLVFSLFLLFPFSSKAGIYFLPDAQNEEISNTLSTPPVASIDSMRCEEIGYTYYASGVCPAYHNQEVCGSEEHTSELQSPS